MSHTPVPTGPAGTPSAYVLTVQGISAMTPILVDGSGVTQPVSAASLPLPAGAATSALQSTGNTSLGNIDGKLPSTLGQKIMDNSLAVTLASNQSSVPVKPDNVDDAVITSGSATSTADVVSVGTAGFMGGSFQVTSAGSSCTVSYEQSNDGTNWVALVVMSAATSAGSPVTSSTATGIFDFVTRAAFVRARVSTYGSGTVSITLVRKRVCAPIAGLVLATGSSTIGNFVRQSGFTDSTTALTAGATFTGSSRTTTTTYTRFCATAFADQAGTLNIEQSLDSGTTWQVVGTAAVAANVVQQITVNVTGAAGSTNLFRVRYVNGGTNQTLFRLSSALLQ